MRYNKSEITNTARKLKSRASGLSSIQNDLSRVSPECCDSNFYSRRYALTKRIRNVQKELTSLSRDIETAASQMSSDDVQNARHIRQALKNRGTGSTFGTGMNGAQASYLGGAGVIGSSMEYSTLELDRGSAASLGQPMKASKPWYEWVGDGIESGAKTVGNWGKKAYNATAGFVSDAADWTGEKWNDFTDWTGEKWDDFTDWTGEKWDDFTDWTGDRWDDLKEWGSDRWDDVKGVGNYVWKSLKKFVCGDYIDGDITILSFLGNIVTSIVGVDIPLDIRDLIYDIQHWGEGENFGLWFAVDVIALIPLIGTVKYVKYGKYVDDAADFVDGVKDLGKIADAADDLKDAEKAADAVDDIKDAGKTADAIDDTADIGKAADDVKIKPSNSYDEAAKPSGKPAEINDNMDAETVRSLTRENEAADTLAKNGYQVEQNPVVSGTTRNPDYIIEGKVFDCYAPSATKSVRGVWSTIYEKVITKGQTKRIVLNLSDWTGNTDDLVTQLKTYSIEGLEEVLVVRGDEVISIFP